MFVCYVNIQIQLYKKEGKRMLKPKRKHLRKPYICGTFAHYTRLVKINIKQHTIQSIAITFHQFGFYY